MSKGLGKASKKLLIRLYGNWSDQKLDELTNQKERKSNFYVLERLIEKGLVKKKRTNIGLYYGLTDQGRKVAEEIVHETDDFIKDMYGWWETGDTKRRAQKLLKGIVEREEKIIEQQQEELESKIPDKDVVVLDFYGEWCEPCKLLAPFIDNLKNEFEDQVTVKKINVDGNNEVADKYNVGAVPTVIILKNGEVIERTTGFSNNVYSQINGALNRALGIKTDTPRLQE